MKREDVLKDEAYREPGRGWSDKTGFAVPLPATE